MIELTLQEIARVTGGHVTGAALDPSADGRVVVTGDAYLDSRNPVPGGLFVAVRGRTADGHEHAGGAHAVLGTRPTTRPTVVVPDVVVALGDLARHVVRRLSPRVLAVTGSHGKTATKDFLAAVLPTATATLGNRNNELGVALTALRLSRPGEDLVLEMGARGVGQLTYLTSIAEPSICAVTAVGLSHVGRFGSPDLLARAKRELPEATRGTCVLNADDPRTLAMAPFTGARVITFGTRGDVSWSGVRLDDAGRASFRLHWDGRSLPVSLRVVGEHQVANAACASAMALAAGVAPEAVAAGLERAVAGPHRLERRTRADGGVLLDDCYNAAPASMLAALRTLAAVAPRGQRVAALGPMGELGAASPAEHRAVARAALRLGVEVVAVGPGAELLLDGVPAVSGRWVPDGDAAARVLRRRLRPADVLLVKASRTSALEFLVELICAPEPGSVMGFAES